jgi:uncharacterized protein YndB with AHSA1/START domain
MMQNPITVVTQINRAIDQVWKYWTLAEHIIAWNFASEDWHAPHATNDLQVDGRFAYEMAAKDGSFSFTFSGTYTEVLNHQKIAYTLDDGRKVEVHFVANEEGTLLTELFEAEQVNPRERQQFGWQYILDNFKRHCEQQPS